MNKKILTTTLWIAALGALATPGLAAEFYLRADVTTKTMPDGQVIPMWGFALDSAFDANDGTVTIPGPLLTVPPGDNTLTIHLKNNLTAARTGLAIGCPVSLVIPGQITAMTPVRFGPMPYPQFEGRVRSLTHETEPNNSSPVDYTWTNFAPGTYVYHSGTHIQCHVQMGLYGGVIKDYAAGPQQAYPGVIYETAVPVFFSEIDPAFHAAVDANSYGPGKPRTSAMGYEARYFLINGEAFTSSQLPVAAGSHGGGTLLRFFNMGLETRCPLLQGSYMTVIAEDGRPYRYPKQHYVVSLPAGKTLDAMVAFPAAGTYPLYDRRLGLTNAQATGGGMLTRLAVSAGNSWPVITAVTATPATITDSQTSQLQATATDSDGPAPLSYSWEIPPGSGSLDDPTIANPVFTPSFTATTQTYTLTVTVSDGAHADLATVNVTVNPTVTLLSIEISGPATVDENATAQYTALAQFSDGTSGTVQPQVWSVDAAEATIDATGLLTAGAVDGDTPAVITAEYTLDGTTATDTHSITILNAAAPPVEVIVDNRDAATSSVGTWDVSASPGFWATDSVFSRSAGGSFTFNANLVPGTTYQVYGWWTYSSTRHTAVPYDIRDGATLLGTTVVNQRLNAAQWNLLGTYIFNGPASVTVRVVNTTNSNCADAVRFVPVGAPTLQSLVISGPATVNENATAQYTATAHYSDGSSATVQPQVWSVDVAQASIDATGLLTTGAVDADTPAVISAQYTANGTTVNDTHNLTILNGGAVPVEVIVDNRDAATSSVGTWDVSASPGFWATDSVFSRSAGGSFTFNANLVPGTTYQVYGWWTYSPSRHTAVPYDIRDGATLLGTTVVNQRANGGQWNLLGTYTFNGPASVTVRVVNTTNSNCADAVRFVPVP